MSIEKKLIKTSDSKKSTILMLKGYSCVTCKYRVQSVAILLADGIAEKSTIENIKAGLVHCGLRTDSENQPTNCSLLKDDVPCIHYYLKNRPAESIDKHI